MADMTRLNTELRGKLEKTMEQLIAAQTAKEHARQQAQEQAAKAKQVISQYEHVANERNALQAAVGKWEAQWRELRNKYNQKSSTLKEVGAGWVGTGARSEPPSVCLLGDVSSEGAVCTHVADCPDIWQFAGSVRPCA
jgi:DNA repair exonuclease SbcCD ATPase subunit